MFQLFLEGLDESRRQVFKELKPFADKFVLAGGTAIMLQINHRESFDFDLFTNKPFSNQLKIKFNRIFGVSKPKLETSEIMLFQTKNNIDVHFVYYKYPNLQKLVKTDSLCLFHLDDLAANKTFTIGQRATWRDYVDLFFLLKWNLYTIEKMISLAKKKFGFEFNERLFVQQLSYFADIPVTPITFLKEKYSDKEIQTHLQDSVSAYFRDNPKFQ